MASGDFMSTIHQLPSDLSVGAVHLRVRSLDDSLRFYENTLGLTSLRLADGGVALSPGPDAAPILRLSQDPLATPQPPGGAGLYHFAILLPDRRELARAFLRVRSAGWSFQGFADHAVSEAVYLSDPEGNGIELYADRPRDRWERRSAEIYMTTRPLDLRGLLAEADPAESRSAGLPPGTRIGHVHLKVSDLTAAESFYAGLLGFDVTNRSYPGAMFFGAGGYHHHIGTNTWESHGGAALSSRAIGLIEFTLELSGRAGVGGLRQQLGRAGWDTWDADAGWRTRDRDGIAIQVRLRQGMPAGR